MISKDLLYALQTRGKKLIRELDGFTDDIENYSFDDGWTIVTETIKLVRELAPTQGKYSATIKAVNRGWVAFCEQSEKAANTLYAAIISELEGTRWTQADKAQAGYQLIYAFHDRHLRCQNLFSHLALRQYSHRLLALIEKMAPHSGQTLFANPIQPGNGTGADAIEMVLEVYFYHAALCGDEDLRADAAQLLMPLVRANPGLGNGLTFALLEHHPQRSEILGQLIDFYLATDESVTLFGMFFDLMEALLDNDGSSFAYEDLGKITAQLELSSKRWSSSQFDTFVRYTFFSSGETDEDRCLLLSKSKKARRLAEMVIDSGHAGAEVAALAALYKSIGQPARAPTTLTAPVRQFKDLNFKLLVIQELMYDQKLLPPFDVREFAKKYTDREIMIEKEGYAVIPEVLAYFEALSIPAPLLAHVCELGFDGGNAVYSQVFPYWDGECNTFDVMSVEDIALVPNLKRISCMPEEFVKQHGAGLSRKSIEVD